MQSVEFIAVQRVVIDKHKREKVVPETINLAEIKTFRPWYDKALENTENDPNKNKYTLLVLYNTNKSTGENDDEDGEKKKNYNTVKINEKYDDFSSRLGAKVIIR